jgi:hypothetical protein
MPGNCTLLSIDASHAIPTCVLCFEVSGRRRRTSVRPVLLTSQSGTHRWDKSDPPVKPVQCCYTSVFGLGFGDQLRNQVVLWWTTRNPVNMVWPPANLHSWLGTHEVSARLWFWRSTKKPSTTSSCCFCYHAPALDPAGQRVPWTKPTCLLHTWRPHRHRPFGLVPHLHQN